MKYATIIVILAVLNACSVIPQYSQSQIPEAANLIVCLNVTMAKSLQESQQTCRDEFGVTAISCAEYPRGDLYPQRMIFWRPVDFNDNETMKAIGHEFIHVLGGKHE